jgi:hypothetical protein
VQLYVEQGVKAFGEVTDALRIRSTPPPPPQEQKQVDVTVAILNLTSCTNQEELRNVYTALSTAEKNHPSVIKMKDELKASLPV